MIRTMERQQWANFTPLSAHADMRQVNAVRAAG